MIPYQIKVKLHLLRRGVYDIVKGYFFNYARSKNSENDYSKDLKIRQELKPNEAKKKNLLKAIKSIEAIEIKPNEIFSFWRIVGNPSKKNGFVSSRSLVNGKIENSIGGGLCQLSGLIYYISLYAKLDTLERHNHSIDIYTDETRFTPLGTDATVAYGYKDLKIRNNLTSSMKFTFSMDQNFLIINLMHSSLIEINDVAFQEKIIDKNTIEITTIINQQVTNKSTYKRYVPNNV
jgi:vancomycin resistance protein VanW